MCSIQRIYKTPSWFIATQVHLHGALHVPCKRQRDNRTIKGSIQMKQTSKETQNKAVSVQVMRDSDAWTIANKVPSKELMFRAGKGIFEAVDWKGPVAIVCGSGNNAGDGYVVADLLHGSGIRCTIVLLSEKFSEDGAYYFEQCKEHGVPVTMFPEEEPELFFQEYKMILDCILGTGFSGEVHGKAAEAIDAINASGAYVVSADINSGLNGDTGRGTRYVRSDLTVSIGDYKFGHFKGLAAAAMKEKVNIDIGIELCEEAVPVEEPFKILVFSDSHGRKGKVKKILESHKDPDAVIFLGDGEADLELLNLSEDTALYQVRGNCDRVSRAAVTLVEEIAGVRFYITHGYEQGVKYGLGKFAALAKEEGCRAALFGHTHRVHLSEEDGVFLFNPGSAANGDYGMILIDGETLDFVPLSLTGV